MVVFFDVHSSVYQVPFDFLCKEDEQFSCGVVFYSEEDGGVGGVVYNFLGCVVHPCDLLS